MRFTAPVSYADVAPSPTPAATASEPPAAGPGGEASAAGWGALGALSAGPLPPLHRPSGSISSEIEPAQVREGGRTLPSLPHASSPCNVPKDGAAPLSCCACRLLPCSSSLLASGLARRGPTGRTQLQLSDVSCGEQPGPAACLNGARLCGTAPWRGVGVRQQSRLRRMALGTGCLRAGRWAPARLAQRREPLRLAAAAVAGGAIGRGHSAPDAAGEPGTGAAGQVRPLGRVHGEGWVGSWVSGRL